MKHLIFLTLFLLSWTALGQNLEQKSFTIENYIREVCSPLDAPEQKASCFNKTQELIKAIKSYTLGEISKDDRIREICLAFQTNEQQRACSDNIHIFIDSLSQNPEEKPYTRDYILKVCHTLFDNFEDAEPRVACAQSIKQLMTALKNDTTEENFKLEDHIRTICSPLTTSEQQQTEVLEKQTSCFNDVQVLVKAVRSQISEAELQAESHIQEACSTLKILEQRFSCFNIVQTLNRAIEQCAQKHPDICFAEFATKEPCGQKYPFPNTNPDNSLLQSLLSEMSQFCSTRPTEQHLPCLINQTKVTQLMYCSM